MKAVILAIGTEITDGEIVDRNSQWLSERLVDLNIRPKLHLSIPDDLELIKKMAMSIVEEFQLIIFTGGLGPTSDDLTRQVIAEFTGCPLEFNKEVYLQLQKLLKQRGREVKAGHKVQCQFPQGSEILKNTVGTAQGFWQSLRGKYLVVLPGPPREIESIWENSLKQKLEEIAPPQEETLYKWTCQGAGESVIAEVIESLNLDPRWTIGYRASHPVVYVKIWVPKSTENHEMLEKISKSLSQWLVVKG